MKVEQAADCMMVIEPVSFGGKLAEAGGALKALDAGNEIPAVAPVAAYDGPPRTQP